MLTSDGKGITDRKRTRTFEGWNAVTNAENRGPEKVMAVLGDGLPRVGGTCNVKANAFAVKVDDKAVFSCRESGKEEGRKILTRTLEDQDPVTNIRRFWDCEVDRSMEK